MVRRVYHKAARGAGILRMGLIQRKGGGADVSTRGCIYQKE